MDVTSVIKDGKNQLLQDTTKNPQKNEPKIARELTKWLREDDRVRQVLTPWSMGEGKPNKNEKPLEIQHKNHFHIGIIE